MPARDERNLASDKLRWRRFVRDAGLDVLPVPPDESLFAYHDGRHDVITGGVADAWLAGDPVARRVFLDSFTGGGAVASRSAIRRAQALVKEKDTPPRPWLDQIGVLSDWLRPSPAFVTAAVGACIAALVAFEAGMVTSLSRDAYEGRLAAALWSAEIPLPYEARDES